MMWAKRQGREILRAYTRGIYLPFWRRELDAEDPRVITAMLEQAGADVRGFAEFSTGDGRAEHDAMQPAIFDAGIFGVPTYVVEREIYFGREHLPRVRWIAGRPSRPGARHRVSTLRGGFGSGTGRHGMSELALPTPLRMGIDFKQPQSYLAKGPTQKLAASLGIAIDWLPMSARPFADPAVEMEGDSRGARHRRFRAEYFERDMRRYAASQGLVLGDLHRSADSSLAGMGLLWAKKQRGAAPSWTPTSIWCSTATGAMGSESRTRARSAASSSAPGFRPRGSTREICARSTMKCSRAGAR